MYKSKSELVEMVSGMEDANIAESTIENIAGSAEFFEGFAALLRGAEARLLSAASVLALSAETKPTID